MASTIVAQEGQFVCDSKNVATVVRTYTDLYCDNVNVDRLIPGTCTYHPGVNFVVNKIQGFTQQDVALRPEVQSLVAAHADAVSRRRIESRGR